MAINCPDPAFPVEVRSDVLSDGSFGSSGVDGSPFWEFSCGWENIGGTLIGDGITNGPCFIQRSSKFKKVFGAGDDDINIGDQYILEFGIIDAALDRNSTNDYGQLRILWGTFVGDWIRGSNGIKRQTVIAPAAGDFNLRVRNVFGESFFGKITHCVLFNISCIASSEVETGGSGGDIGTGDGDVSGGVGGIVLEAGETPNTGFSSKYYGEDKEEIFRTDMRIFDNEIDDDFGRDSLGGQ